MAEFGQGTIVAMLGEAGGASRVAVDAVQHHGLTSVSAIGDPVPSEIERNDVAQPSSGP